MIKSLRSIPVPLHVVAYEEDDLFIVQCLEYDIAAHGHDPVEARRAFTHALIRHAVTASEFNRPLFDGVPKAPQEFWRLWDVSEKRGDAPERLEIPRFTLSKRKLDESVEGAMPQLFAELLTA